MFENKRYGVIGEHLAHSRSKEIHARFGYDYSVNELKPEELGDFVQHSGYDGFNVTIPYKKAVMPYLSRIDAYAAACGAVNTVVKEPYGYVGYNTDVFGLVYMIKSAGMSLQGKKTLILGKGGAALAAYAAAKELNAAEILFITRGGADNFGNLERHSDAEIIINATPVGMYPNAGESAVDLSVFDKPSAAVDLVYNPLKTAFIFQAELLGIPYVSGLKMLVAQAKYAAELFTGEAYLDSVIEEIYRDMYFEASNIVLIGMPSSGKTEIGKLLAEKTGKAFADTDEVIERDTGITIPEIFRTQGEAAFREYERRVIDEYGRMSGRIISTGGGSVTVSGAYSALKQNGIAVHLVRDKAKVDPTGRPLLSEPGAYERLGAVRMPAYKRFADVTVSNDGEKEKTVEEILKKAKAFIAEQ
ncbi:MAG: shikimate kinase [Clostridiales bacterium]|jgi:shikimate dehydrogenase|nr:shikimate kinase [Clostridiales bacterium]